VNGAQLASGVGLILLDIEGTTTPVAFVTDVLFPYARTRVRSYLNTHLASVECASIVNRLRAEHESAAQSGEAVPAWGDAADVEGAIAYIEWLMERDRKSTGLKELQGHIWEEGYRRGELLGEVFADVPVALHRWRDQHVQAGIFSSGSVLAQQLLFRYSSAGDLTNLLRWHFDTRIGAKDDPESYRRIAAAVGLGADAVLFLSDTTRELDAARAAGMQLRLVVRERQSPVDTDRRYERIHSFDELTFA
jgi:enolase-phosphatase E1